MFFFENEMYNDSLYYFRLFKLSNFYIRLFDLIDIQDTIEKITFQKILNRELDNSNRENRFIFDISIEQQTTSFCIKQNRKFKRANSNRKIIIYKFEIIDNIIILQIIDNFIDFFNKYNIIEFAYFKIKIDRYIENIFNMFKYI